MRCIMLTEELEGISGHDEHGEAENAIQHRTRDRQIMIRHDDEGDEGDDEGGDGIRMMEMVDGDGMGDGMD